MKKFEVWGFNRLGEKDYEVVTAETAQEAVDSLRPYGFRAYAKDAREILDGSEKKTS